MRVATPRPRFTNDDWHHRRRRCRGTDNERAGRRRWHRFAYYASSLRDLRAALDNIRRDATPWPMLQTYPLGISNRSHNHSVTVSRQVSPYIAFPSQTRVIVNCYVWSKFLARIYDYSFLIEDAATIATLTTLTDHLKIPRVDSKYTLHFDRYLFLD